MNWLYRTIYRLGQPHPRIVVVRKAHHSNRSDDIKTALDGMIQSASILALTFMFGSIWGFSGVDRVIRGSVYVRHVDIQDS